VPITLEVRDQRLQKPLRVRGFVDLVDGVVHGMLAHGNGGAHFYLNFAHRVPVHRNTAKHQTCNQNERYAHHES
jgi:hypothetical protein